MTLTINILRVQFNLDYVFTTIYKRAKTKIDQMKSAVKGETL